MSATTVFEARPPDGYEWVMPTRDEGMDILLGLDGSSRASGWTPIEMKLIREDRESRLDTSRESDLPWFGDKVLVLRRRALGALGPLLRLHGELLSLECEDAELWLFNPTTLLDALDEGHSELRRFSDGAIMDITRPAFKEDAVRGVAAFKVVQDPRGPLFLGEALVQKALEAALRGVEFEPVWTSQPHANGLSS